MKLKVAVTSMIGTVVAMGLGRFALTPQLPHMIDEGQINLTQASLLAASNFLGYLLGAIEITRARHHNMMLRFNSGLWGSGVILLLSALIPNDPAGFYLNLLLRFAAGIASAWALILITTWVQHELKADHALRTMAFAGPGVGITFSGLLAIGFDYWHTHADFNWLIYGLSAMLMMAVVYKNLPSGMPQVSTETRFPMTNQIFLMVITYILCGVGYVLPATFLSKLAADQFPGSLMADAFWPIFGLAVILSMAIFSVQKIKQPQIWLTGIFAIQALGNLACVFLPGIWGLLLGALFVGGTFMAILQLMMQLGAELAPCYLRTVTGLLTIGFGIGQLIGPLLSAASTHFFASMTPALLAAAFGSFMAAFMIYSITPP